MDLATMTSLKALQSLLDVDPQSRCFALDTQKSHLELESRSLL